MAGSSKALRLEGSITALVTPFVGHTKAIDFPALRRIVDDQIARGINGLLSMGSTGEFCTVTHDEHDKVNAAVVEYSAGRVPVIAGTGSNSTIEAVRLTQAAKDAGAAACLVAAPYYNKPSQRGMYEHFKAVQDVGLPVILYCNASRSGATMTMDTVAALAKLPHVVGWKEATASLTQASDVAARTDLAIFAGDDVLTVPIMAIGGVGVTSVLSNIAPEKVLAITDAMRRGDYAGARAAHFACVGLTHALFETEVNPQGVKKAMELLGYCSAACRLPLVEASAASTAILTKQLQADGLLEQ
ncbi:dihydrodipicolinate synthase [Aphanomyces astaci]|uniref:4-hydroxy-tetrahydrodipicolinate synthase n=1 Tax=Aphanomyces astaci TaxID=112090 RepID=W4GBA8_APHAT|nr:dihydrodipicolinate synthase [Aphanomyces astaci]ETV76955.1 dihydrodipicolinate synthase [Aphanomyces astaci]|eukprot:XP_009833868.1 dihydrodipicolinate synthase [Aphanomyces astaci]